MKLLRFKKNNKGMTLVELLVAIAIFAAAIVPMLYAFVYSTAFNFKSQQTMQSTGIAQAIIEKCKGANVDQAEIVGMLTDGSIFDGTRFIDGTAEGFDGTYYTITGIHPEWSTDGGTTRRAYDVKVRFYEIENDSKTDYSSIQSMTNDTTYNFCDFLTDALVHEDELAEGKMITKIKNKWFTDANCEYSDGTDETGIAAYFNEGDIDVTKIKLDREINVTVSDTGVNVTVNYFFAGYDSGDAYDTITFSKSGINGKTAVCSTSFNSSEGIALGESNPVSVADFDTYVTCDYPVTSVFFYYYPGYMSESKISDYFNIINTMTSAVEYHPIPGDPAVEAAPSRLDFYLYKQFKPFGGGWTQAKYNLADGDYDPVINLENGPKRIESYFYHNLWWHIKNVSALPGQHDYEFDNTFVSGFHGNTSDLIYDPDEWINCTTADTAGATYSTGWRDTSSNPGTGKIRMYSHVLRDYESIPGYYDDVRGSVSDTSRDSFYSRYRVEVIVYSSANGNEVERMYAEVLNW